MASQPELKLGSITEIWKSKTDWLQFCQYLDTSMEPEGMILKLLLLFSNKKTRLLDFH